MTFIIPPSYFQFKNKIESNKKTVYHYTEKGPPFPKIYLLEKLYIILMIEYHRLSSAIYSLLVLLQLLPIPNALY